MRIIWNQITSSGRRTSWAKPFDRIDTHVRGAKAFCFRAGDGYLRDGVETNLPEGALVLEVRPAGSVKHASREAVVYEVVAEEEEDRGKLSPVLEGYDSDKQYLTFIDDCQKALAARVLADDSDSNPLASYTVEQLLAELERRGASWMS